MDKIGAEGDLFEEGGVFFDVEEAVAPEEVGFEGVGLSEGGAFFVEVLGFGFDGEGVVESFGAAA